LFFCKWIFTSFQVFYVIEVIENDERRIIGFVGLYGIKINYRVWLSITVIKPEDRRCGFGEKAIRLLLDYLQLNAIVEKVSVEILKTNEPSLYFFKDLGFEIYEQKKDKVLLEKCIKKETAII
jgi:RimJ/RimL family protein N-acetyltransferase